MTRLDRVAIGSLVWLAGVLALNGTPIAWLVPGLLLAVAGHRLLNTQPVGLLVRQVDNRWRVPGRAGRWRLRTVRLLPVGLLRLEFQSTAGAARVTVFLAEDAVGPLAHWRLRVSLLEPDCS